MKNIRNFCIIAHIDHGKSTLADRFLEITGTLQQREMKHGQLLDSMDIEQERGITIKLTPVRMNYKDYILNLIDTPGHVDFTYEVSRSLAACEGAILVVDAAQGIEAQTIANLYLAIEQGLDIIPVVNKIDLPNADPDKVTLELANLLSVDPDSVLRCSAKTGEGVREILDAVIERFHAPQEVEEKALKALIFDSNYDPYKGVVAYVRVVSGEIKKNQKLYMMGTRVVAQALELGYFRPKYFPADTLQTGEVGYIVTGCKTVSEARVGDTVTLDSLHAKEALPGYRKVIPMVFAGIFCSSRDDYHLLKDALEKLALNDSSLVFEPEVSVAMGFGFRCGFLGLLHLEIVQERLEREYNLDLIVTAPSVSYKVYTTKNEVLTISNPAQLPDPSYIEKIEEPMVRIEILTRKQDVGSIMQLAQERRGTYQNTEFLDENRAILKFMIPLASIVIDFYDKLKSISSGYASLSYDLAGYQAGDLIKLDILIAGEKVDAFSQIVIRDEAFRRGSQVVKKLKDLIPRQQFKIALQASIGAKVIAREDISAMRKDVTAGLYGGDVTRKNKLLNKQKKGKKKMKQMGKVNIPQEAFLEVLKKD
ncbi:MAG: translation elongation factor 4 [Candidatus Gracilibacteria bacterium]|nr:translation elongation factor 4 [Candidatus Gracilibacteria bacterium]